MVHLPAAQATPGVGPPLARLLSENTAGEGNSLKKHVTLRRMDVGKEERAQPLKIMGVSGSAPGCGRGRGAGGRFWMMGLKAQVSSTVS